MVARTKGGRFAKEVPLTKEQQIIKDYNESVKVESTPAINPTRRYMVSMTSYNHNGEIFTQKGNVLSRTMRGALDDIAFTEDSGHYEITIDVLS